jgi:general secretion pathway protein B
MSLILEALKKSEAERRLGRAPGLSTPMPSFRRRRRNLMWPGESGQPP